MFVHAHPDDESSKGAGTMARYVKEGYRVSVVTLTDGRAGDVLNPRIDPATLPAPMVEVRRAELAEALRVLGITEHHPLDYPDSGWVDDFDGDGTRLAPDAFYNVALQDVLERLVPLLRSSRPHVVVTYDENGGYPHPDHIRTHQVTVAALDAAADPRRFPDAGPTWRPAKLYYFATFNRRRVLALHHACLEHGLESPFARWMDRLEEERPPDRITTQIDVGDHLATARAALRAHATQVDPDGRWFSIPDEVVRGAYPWEDYRLARSEVATDRPERSLFAGLE